MNLVQTCVEILAVQKTRQVIGARLIRRLLVKLAVLDANRHNRRKGKQMIHLVHGKRSARVLQRNNR